MIKICILSSVHSAQDTRVFYKEAKSLKKSGYDVHLIAVNDQNEIQDGINIVGLPYNPIRTRLVGWLRLLRKAIEIDADLYHFHDPELLLVNPFLRFLYRKPTIYDIHESNKDFVELKEGIPKWIRRPVSLTVGLLEPALAALTSGLIFADDNIAEQFQYLKIPKVTLFNFPSEEVVDNGRLASEQVNQKEPIILHLGGHKKGRGVGLMIDAFEIVLAEIPEAHLFLVGSFVPKSLEEQVRQIIAERQLAHAVTITGRVPYDQIDRFLRQAAVGWIPLQPVSKYQKNIPTKLFEYMAYGLPVVSSDLLPVRQFLVQGKTGYLVQAENPKSHADALNKLLKKQEFAQKMGCEGQKLIQSQYNWNSMEERLLGLYNEVLGH
jgi:glycosyltransferase involved in cell wall biosynthesis